MARISFEATNVKKNDYDFPKLKMKKNEVARIVLLEDPVMEYVHDMREPKLINGIPEKVMKSRKDGTQYEDYVYNFVGRPMCLGDEGTLADIGSDPVNCPVCAEAKASDRAAAPKRRFAMHVMKYATKPGGSEVQTPFSVQSLIYSFTDKVFATIVGFKEEWGDLRTHDIILKCTNEGFQTYEMTLAAKAAWTEDKERQAFTKLTFKENQAPDPAIFCGNRKEAKYLEMDLNQIRNAWRIALGVSDSAADAATAGVGAVDLDSGLADLLGGGAVAQTEWLSTPEEAKETVAMTSPAVEPEEKKQAPAAAPAPVEDFDDLLAGL